MRQQAHIQSPQLTSVSHVELDSKISSGASGVVAGRKDNPTDRLDLSDDA